MQSDVPAIDATERIQALTREYSRYSRSAGGLSAVAGGVACLISYVAGATLPMTPFLRIALVGLPVLWLIGKVWLATRYYQSFGRVQELMTPIERRFQHFFVGFTALVSLVIVATALSRFAPLGARPWNSQVAGYVAVIALLPFVVWRWLRTPLEFIVGVFLLCQAALVFAGRSYGFGMGTAVFPIVSISLIAAGLRDHRRFLQLRAELRAIMRGGRAPE
jgi:hypothetical protein